MMSATLLSDPSVLDPDYIPDEIVDREDARDTLADALAPPGSHIHVCGPHGTGKTLLLRTVLEDVGGESETCVLSCIQEDTQYKVLAQLAETVTGTDIGSGYHTAQLQDHVAERIADRPLVIVLDDVDFLLANDGSDLLYYLSRLAHDALRIVTVSANHPDLSTVVDERTFSTLTPTQYRLDPYTVHDTYQILHRRTRAALTRGHPFPKDSLSHIATSTANIHLGLCWLHEAATAADDQITANLVQEVRSAAIHRYREYLLSSFTPHHHLLCDVIETQTADREAVHSGSIYDRYEERCRTQARDPLTRRRVSDFLKDLELLGIIEADYHYGGAEGKTREIQLQQV